MPKKWIKTAIQHPGALREALHVKEGDTIPMKKLHTAMERGGVMARRAHLAVTLKHLRKD